MPTHRTVKLDELSQYFHLPEKAVAKQLGVCLTSLKKICRQNGITRWPYRKLKSLDKKIVKIETALTNPSVSEDQNTMMLKWEMLKNEKKNLPFQGSADDSEAETTRRTSPPVANTGRGGSSAASHPHQLTATSTSAFSTTRRDSSSAVSSFAGSRSLLSQRLRQVGNVATHRHALESMAKANGGAGTSLNDPPARHQAAAPAPLAPVPSPLKTALTSPMAPAIASPHIPFTDDSAAMLRGHEGLEVDVSVMPLSHAMLSHEHTANGNRLQDFYARDSARDPHLDHLDSARLSARHNAENPFHDDAALGELYAHHDDTLKNEPSLYDDFMLLSNA